MSIEYRHNTSSQFDILYHLQNVSSAFVHDLSNRVDVKEYSQKLFSLAEREEAWSGDNLIGLVAYYINHDTQKAFITNVSVDIRFQKQGIATTLLENVKCAAVNERMNLISLEVAQDERLIDFYRHNGFVEEKQMPNGNKILIKNLVPIVVIRCTVYNHEPYLRDCLEGFVMQQTNFPFVAIVHDDASTDNSAVIIREYEEKYPNIIKPIYEKENQWRKGTLTKVMNIAIDATGAKYVAMCEGDDYWTDPLKLQKQVDFLESHPEYAMCFHKVEVISHDKNDENLYSHLQEKEYTASEIYEKWTVPTCSVVYRKSNLNLRKPKTMIFGDIVLLLSLAKGGKVFCMDFNGGVYRRLTSGTSSKYSNDTLRKLYHQYQEMITLFPEVRDISIKNRNEYLGYVIYDKAFKGTWKYRLHYMWLNKQLLFSRFALATIKYLFV